jgi:uncharacterized RDD family membrane protein YckC
MSSVDKLIIETPEQTSLEFPLAGIGSRFLALAADTLLQMAVFAVLAIAAAVLSLANLLSAMTKQWVMAILLFVFFSVQFGYFALFESLWNGQTPGKRWTRLRVIKDDGRPITPYDAILRNLLRTVDALPTLYATGIICILISRENKRVGDFAAGTVVIHEKPLEGVSSIWEASTPQTQANAWSALPQLTLEELRLIEAFFGRRSNLDPDVRRMISSQIADRLGARLGVDLEARPDAEKFLDYLASQRRNSARFS